MSYFDNVGALCPGDLCDVYIGGEYIYRDQNHLRRNLSDAARRELANRLHLEDVVARLVP